MFHGLLHLIHSNYLSLTLYHTIFRYPTPVNINYFWNFGFLALITLVCQIITGILLAMYYLPSASFAFDSVEIIMREINFG